MHNQGLHQLLLAVRRTKRAKPRGPCFSVFTEATHKASWGTLKGAMSAQKALQESKIEARELLGLTKEKSVSLTRGHWFTLQANKWIFFKRLTEKIELVPIPVSGFQALVEGVCWFQVWPETF